MTFDTGPGRAAPSVQDRGWPKYWAFQDHRTMAQVMADEQSAARAAVAAKAA